MWRVRLFGRLRIQNKKEQTACVLNARFRSTQMFRCLIGIGREGAWPRKLRISELVRTTHVARSVMRKQDNQNKQRDRDAG